MFVAIVPAYNEEKRIGSVIKDLFEHVDIVVVVDDASVDDTVLIAKRLGAVVLTHDINRGQGAALQTGHDYACSIGATRVLHFDGDAQFDVNDIPDAVCVMDEQGVDIVFGSRFLGKKANIPFLKRYFFFPIGRLVNYIFAGVRLSEVHNGFRLLNKNALEKVVIKQDGMAHATEILALARRHGLKYSEVPVSVTYHEFGQGVRGGVKIVKDLLMSKFIR